MGLSFNVALLLQDLLCVQQAVQASILAQHFNVDADGPETVVTTDHISSTVSIDLRGWMLHYSLFIAV